MQTEKEYFVLRELSSLRCESVGEYSLPDYNTDVKKLLTVKTKVFPTGKFVGEDTLEFSGTVGYEVVYLDAENNVTHAELSTDYEAALKISSESYVDSDVSTVVSACNVRLIGPRKLSVKCSLDSDVNICERRGYVIDGDAFLEYVPETLDATASIQHILFLPRTIYLKVVSILKHNILCLRFTTDYNRVLIINQHFSLSGVQ